jgi:hypothetical protein
LNTSRLPAHLTAWIGVAGACLALEACTPPPPPPPVSTAREYQIDQVGGAKLCTAPKLTLTDGKTTDATIAVGNDGGWCAISVTQTGPKPYDAGLLTGKPAHGKVYIHTVGDDTRIDYTPDANFAGADAYTVSLLPGSPVLHVAVTVTR